MVKKLFIDTETTGPKSDRHGLIEIGGIIEYGKIHEEFLFNCDLFDGDEIDPVSLEVHGYTDEDISRFPDPYDVHEKLIGVFEKHIDRYSRQDKFIFLAYGAEFDDHFLRTFFDKIGDKYYGSWFYTPPVCIMSLAAYALQEERHRMENFKLETVARFTGVEVEGEKTHNALYDAKIARELYNRISFRIMTVKTRDEVMEERIKIRGRRLMDGKTTFGGAMNRTIL